MNRKRSLAALFGAATVGLALTACGPSTHGSPPPAPTPAPTPSPTGIGPAGGSVTEPYGGSVTVPAGALSTTVAVAIARDSTGAPNLPDTGIDSAGAPYALTPHGTAFAAPATVSVPFDDARIPTDATPTLYKAEPGGSFTAIPTTIGNGVLSADVGDFSWVIPGYASTRPRAVYALTSDSGGFHVASFKIDKSTGALSAATSTAPTGDGPISVAVHPSRRFVFVTNAGTSTANGVAPGSLSVYRLDSVTGQISGPIGTQPVGGNPVLAVVHPTGKFVYVVNEVRFGAPAGNVSVFSIDAATGALSAPTSTADSGGAPATALALSPSGRFAYVTYLHAAATPGGNTYWDTVEMFGVNPVTGALTGPIGLAATADNPWAIAVTPGGHFAYVASLSMQGSLNTLTRYSIDSQTGAMTLAGSVPVTGQPAALAMDPEGRFLYVARQQPDNNVNLLAFAIDPGSGALSPTAGVLLGGGPEVGPIAVVAEPQGQFVYAEDFSNGSIVSFKLDPVTGQLSPSGSPVTGIVLGGATGGVGDPFSFAASGTSPVWEDGCTILVDDFFVFDGCPHMFLSTGSGGGGGSPPPPPAAHQLDVTYGVWGGVIVSTPAGIDYSSEPFANRVKMFASFPTGSTVKVCGSAPPGATQVYDFKWTGSGGCGGTLTCTNVKMTADESCHLELTVKPPG